MHMPVRPIEELNDSSVPNDKTEIILVRMDLILIFNLGCIYFSA